MFGNLGSTFKSLVDGKSGTESIELEVPENQSEPASSSDGDSVAESKSSGSSRSSSRSSSGSPDHRSWGEYITESAANGVNKIKSYVAGEKKEAVPQKSDLVIHFEKKLDARIRLTQRKAKLLRSLIEKFATAQHEEKKDFEERNETHPFEAEESLDRAFHLLSRKAQKFIRNNLNDLYANIEKLRNETEYSKCEIDKIHLCHEQLDGLNSDIHHCFDELSTLVLHISTVLHEPEMLEDLRKYYGFYIFSDKFITALGDIEDIIKQIAHSRIRHCDNTFASLKDTISHGEIGTDTFRNQINALSEYNPMYQAELMVDCCELLADENLDKDVRRDLINQKNVEITGFEAARNIKLASLLACAKNQYEPLTLRINIYNFAKDLDCVGHLFEGMDPEQKCKLDLKKSISNGNYASFNEDEHLNGQLFMIDQISPVIMQAINMTSSILDEEKLENNALRNQLQNIRTILNNMGGGQQGEDGHYYAPTADKIREIHHKFHQVLQSDTLALIKENVKIIIRDQMKEIDDKNIHRKMDILAKFFESCEKFGEFDRDLSSLKTKFDDAMFHNDTTKIALTHSLKSSPKVRDDAISMLKQMRETTVKKINEKVDILTENTVEKFQGVLSENMDRLMDGYDVQKPDPSSAYLNKIKLIILKTINDTESMYLDIAINPEERNKLAPLLNKLEDLHVRLEKLEKKGLPENGNVCSRIRKELVAIFKELPEPMVPDSPKKSVITEIEDVSKRLVIAAPEAIEDVKKKGAALAASLGGHFNSLLGRKSAVNTDNTETVVAESKEESSNVPPKPPEVDVLLKAREIMAEAIISSYHNSKIKNIDEALKSLKAVSIRIDKAREARRIFIKKDRDCRAETKSRIEETEEKILDIRRIDIDDIREAANEEIFSFIRNENRIWDILNKGNGSWKKLNDEFIKRREEGKKLLREDPLRGQSYINFAVELERDLWSYQREQMRLPENQRYQHLDVPYIGYRTILKAKLDAKRKEVAHDYRSHWKHFLKGVANALVSLTVVGAVVQICKGNFWLFSKPDTSRAHGIDDVRSATLRLSGPAQAA